MKPALLPKHTELLVSLPCHLQNEFTSFELLGFQNMETLVEWTQALMQLVNIIDIYLL